VPRDQQREVVRELYVQTRRQYEVLSAALKLEGLEQSGWQTACWAPSFRVSADRSKCGRFHLPPEVPRSIITDLFKSHLKLPPGVTGRATSSRLIMYVSTSGR
jgi:hypothetical protein